MALITTILGILAGFAILGVIWYIICIIGNWKVFTKAGEAGWKSIIPLYNTYISYKIAWNTNMFWITLACIIVSWILSGFGGILSSVSSLLGLAYAVISIIRLYKLSKAFGHGVGFTLGLIFFNPIFIVILGFDSSEYIGPQ